MDILLPTQRLLLRPFLSEDAQALYEGLSDEAVVRYEPYPPFSLKRAEEETKKRTEDDRFTAVCLPPCDAYPSGRLIGTLFLGPGAFGTWELGYVFNRAHHHKGYATEAATARLLHAFSLPEGPRRVIAVCHGENKPSHALAKRLHMRHEAHHVRDVSFKTDASGAPIWQDTDVFAVLREEFLAFYPPPAADTHVWL